MSKDIRSLLKQYQNIPEAKEFIEKHRRELPVLGYEEDELAFFKSQFIKQHDLSVITDYLHLLKNENDEAVLYDYFYNNMDFDELKNKYKHKYKTYSDFKFVIKDLKEKVINAYYSYLDQTLKPQSKYIRATWVKKNSKKAVVLKNKDKQVTLYLFRVDSKNKLKYSVLDSETIKCVVSKSKLLIDIVSPTEKLIIQRITSKPFESLTLPMLTTFLDIIACYRWVNSDGYLISPDIDLIISDIEIRDELVILSFNEEK